MSNGTDVHGDNHNASLQRVYDNVRAQLDEARKDIHRLQVEADRVTTLYSEAHRRADDMFKINERLRGELGAAHRDLITTAENWHASEKALDAARAEVARLTAVLTEADRSAQEMADEFYEVSEGAYLIGPVEFDRHRREIRAALRQPAPAPATKE